ncbi:peptide/nickel transport system ATP-binding protein [Gemmobacter megaterium]|uniref:Glutathione import ATP-binding protein GsiA n=1 Tax=Gemmobacter megaterium TaxID=1086013 RepID=A0A1N7Q5W9_9RHOB|nr:ABC transporter permease [Gemmobacter megaterium]SIT18258.1 peptide/nickel transport system ATP-binding protein [Gemmobacter megaterium]
MTAPILSVRNLTTAFRTEEGWREVVRNIGFDIHAGETVAVVGESGSGKSVTSLSIMRLLDPHQSRISGQVMVQGRNLLDLTERQMQDVRGNEIAMIFQEPMTSLNPAYTVGRQIAEVLIRHKAMDKAQARTAAIAIMERVRIPNPDRRFDQYPHEFSGGMRQRVMIAMALAARPKLLIADEPTTALDVTIQGQILDLIKELQAEYGMAVLFITHDMGVVAEIADRTVVMFRGDQVETGSTDHVFRRADHPYSRALLAAVPALGAMEGQGQPLRFPRVDMASGAIAPLPPMARPVDRSAAPLLSVRNLVTRFDVKAGLLNRPVSAVHAVEGVSFDLWAGETLALVGESGCGKSTTGRSIMRLVEPRSGAITLQGQDVLALKGAQMQAMRRDIQMIFQDPFSSLNPRMTVGQAVAEPLVKHGIARGKAARARAGELLDQVGLSPAMMDRYPHEFSGGQRQRVAIARVLGLEPKLIVADESVSALDVSIKAQVCNLLMDLQERLGISLLFISHDMAVVERISHRVAVMYLGEIVEIGSREAVFGNPQHAYTQKLIAAVPVPDPDRRLLRRNTPIDELKSPVHPLGYTPPRREWRNVGQDHLVMV